MIVHSHMYGRTWAHFSGLQSIHRLALLCLSFGKSRHHRLVSVVYFTSLSIILKSALVLLVSFFRLSIFIVSLERRTLNDLIGVHFLQLALLIRIMSYTCAFFDHIGCGLHGMLGTVLLQKSRLDSPPSQVLLYEQRSQSSSIPLSRTVVKGLSNRC